MAPAEVEATLRLHPAVIDAAVVPVADPLRGEEIKAYVELAPGNRTRESQLADHCAMRLVPYWRDPVLRSTDCESRWL